MRRFHSMRVLPLAVLLAVAAGCQDFDEALNTDRAPVNPPGIVTEDADDLARADSPDTGGEATPEGTADDAGQPADAADNPPADDGKGIIGKTTNRIVDMHKAMEENPDLQIVENRIEGSDPLTQAASAYVSLRSKPQMLAFQSQIKTEMALNQRPPTYEELQQMMKTHGVQFAMLYPWQMYGYDEKTGKIVILADPAKEAEIRGK